MIASELLELLKCELQTDAHETLKSFIGDNRQSITMLAHKYAVRTVADKERYDVQLNGKGNAELPPF